MNAQTMRALIVGLLVAVWMYLAGYARLNVSVWASIVALGCFFASGGGVLGLQKTLLGTISGVAWVLAVSAVNTAVNANRLVAAIVFGAAVCGMVLQARVPLLGFTGGALAGAGVAVSLGASTIHGAIRAAVALAVGAALGFAAERIAGAIKPGRA